MSDVDHQYINLLTELLVADCVTTRNSVTTRVVGKTVRFTSTPLVSVRKTAWKNALREMGWFLSGSNNINDLHPNVRPWWQPWADKGGHVYYNYSQQFRQWSYGAALFDQIKYLTDGVRDHPFSRRNVITTWNTGEMAASSCPITNCHGTIIQAFGEPDNQLSLLMYQRSADVVCGLPHNWVQYWAFLLWLCHQSNRKPREFIWIGGDVHLYKQHRELAERMIDAAVRCEGVPGLVYSPSGNEFRADDFTLDSPYSPILADRAEMIV